MKLSAYILLFFAVSLLMVNCGQSDQQAKADQNMVAQVANTVQDSENIEVTSESLDENNWYHDWNEGLAAAAKENKPIIVDFYTDWCKWCKVMDKETFAAPEVMDIMTAGWIKIKIDAEEEKKSGTFRDQTFEYNKLSAAFGVSGFPSYLFFNKAGEPITVISGYYETNKFIPVLDYFTKELYTKDVNFQEYIESKS
ncbi:thioredoxin family protein [Candidatus Latescibacterota bacterium]